LQSSPKENKIMAKELSPKQKKIAGAAVPKGKITGADFKALKKGKAQTKSMNRKKGM
jgi:hypothetical protein